MNRKKTSYSSYQGEITPAVPNLLKRDFHANRPNEKWLTDIMEFAIPAGKVYLSPIIDCFDGMPVCWSIGISPNAELTNGMLDKAISLLKVGEHPVVHTDRGCHYRWPGWISRMEAAHLHRSMSKKGCSPDNSACEGFFGRMKNEMFYGISWLNVSIEEFIHTVEDYMVWYREKRIKISLGGLRPLEYRRDYPEFCVTAKMRCKIELIFQGGSGVGCARLVYNITPTGAEVKGHPRPLGSRRRRSAP